MATLTVGPNSTYPTIAAAMAAASLGDTMQLESGYSNETALVNVDNLFVTGTATSTGILLHLVGSATTLTLQGSAPINVIDGTGNDVISGNSGANVITIDKGVDSVDGGLGNDRLVV